MSILNLEKITKVYGERTLLDNVTLGINEGDKIGVVGVNGCGKSTLLKIVAGLEEADSGKIVKGNDVTISYLPQTPVFSKDERIIDYVVGGALDIATSYNSGGSEHELENYDSIAGEAKTILTKLGIDDYEADISKMSGGQKKRIALARSLIRPSGLLILDEPTSGLDPVSRDELLDIFREFVADGKRSILFSTHITSDLDKCADYIMYIKDGCILMNGDREEIIGGYRLVCGGKADMTPELEAALIGVKETAFGFTGLIAERDLNAADGLQTAPADIESIMLYTEKYELHQEA